MSRARRLQPIAELAGHDADAAAQVLAQARDRVAAERRRLNELETYRDDYGARFGGGVMRGGSLRDFQAFIAQLNQAIAEQERVLHGLEQELAQYEQTWRDKRTRAQAMERVVEVHRRSERRASERREQQAADEHASRQHPPGGTRL